jgi:hypothetical protein
MNNSKIFWHFVGSPENIDWSKLKKPKDILLSGNPKKNEESWNILTAILESKKLLATCNEKLYGHRQTDKFCYVTDLPFKSLIYHRKHYGNVAIGFRSSKIYSNFKPVLYTPIEGFLRHAIEVKEEEEEFSFDQLNAFGMDEKTILTSGYTKTPSGTYKGTSTLIDFAKNSPLEKYLLNFVKGTEFSEEPGESFYEEREWRKIGDFIFDFENVAAIVVPIELTSNAITLFGRLGISTVSILTWEVIEKT